MKVELQHITSVVDTRGLTWGENLAGSSGLGSYHKSHPWREKKNHSSTVGNFNWNYKDLSCSIILSCD